MSRDALIWAAGHEDALGAAGPLLTAFAAAHKGGEAGEDPAGDLASLPLSDLLQVTGGGPLAVFVLLQALHRKNLITFKQFSATVCVQLHLVPSLASAPEPLSAQEARA